MSSIKVLIVEDHLITSLGLKMVLDRWPTITVVGEAQNDLKALQLIEQLAPDVMLLDIGLPDIDGIECLARIKSNKWPARILMRSSHEELQAIIAAIAAGADGYCFKDSEDALLIEAIESLATGEAWIHPRIASQLLGFFSASGQQQKYNRIGAPLHLEAEDSALLSAIATGDCSHDPGRLQALMDRIGEFYNAPTN